MSVRAVLGRAECGGASVTYQLALFRELRCGSAALPCYLERAKGCNAPHTLSRHGKNPTASTVRCSTTTTCDCDKARVAAKRDSGNSASTLNCVNPTTNIFYASQTHTHINVCICLHIYLLIPYISLARGASFCAINNIFFFFFWRSPHACPRATISSAVSGSGWYPTTRYI